MPFFELTPEMLQKGMTALGVAAGQIKNIDEETKDLARRFAMRAFGSGDAAGYLKQALRDIEARDREASAPPKPARPTTRVVGEARFEDDTGATSRTPRARR